jgi:hypothetical protein
MACVRLDRVPRNGYCCPKCYREEEEFSNLKFSVGDHFEVRLQTASNYTSTSFLPLHLFLLCFTLRIEVEIYQHAYEVFTSPQIPRRKKGQILTRCYSPSRPLDVAFEECKRKGFMLVSQLFSYELMRYFTAPSMR